MYRAPNKDRTPYTNNSLQGLIYNYKFTGVVQKVLSLSQKEES